MGSRVLQPGFAAKMNENDAKTGNDGLGGAGQNSEPSLHDSDAPGSVPSNGTRRSTMPEWGGVPGPLDGKGRRRILIVDDELAIADTLQMIFQLQRYDARVAYSAERAAELIAKWKPELAIVDVILPEMNGIDLAIVIKANYPKCHVILFSGHTNTSMLLEEAVRKGHNFEVLAKPVLPDLMLERASELLGTPDDPAYD
jgi:CheY-like chemotaxis protein